MPSDDWFHRGEHAHRRRRCRRRNTTSTDALSTRCSTGVCAESDGFRSDRAARVRLWDVATCPTCRADFEAGVFCPRDGTRLAGGERAPVLGDRYRLLRKIGEGGMGEVYEGEHVYIHRRVAVKILRREMASEPEAVERLQREAQSTSGLDHPNIVDCIDFGYSDGQVYLVMEWLEGENLDQRLRRGPVDLATAVDIAAQAAAGLAEAHDRGVIHRDLKPANVFLTRDRRGALVVKVLDFGIAKLAIHQTKLTGTGVLVGTPNYMAPEQAFGDVVDARTDIYALGVILYEMVTGSVPFHADSPLAVLHLHTARIPVPPSARAPERDISTELEAVVMRCLSKRPEDRFHSMQDVLHALGALPHAPAVPEPARRQPPRRPEPAVDDDLLDAAGVRRRGVLPWLILGALVLAGGAVAVALLRPGGGGARPAAAIADAAPVVARPIDAGIDAAATVADAAPAPVDAAITPAWAHEGRGDSFTYVASTATERHAEQPFVLTISLADLAHPAAHALEHDRLHANLELAYFKDHSIVHASTHHLDASLQLRAEIVVPKPGKHHVHVELLAGDRRIGQARFDIVVTP